MWIRVDLYGVLSNFALETIGIKWILSLRKLINTTDRSPCPGDDGRLNRY